MDCTLPRLLGDKKLRASLLEGPISFSDGNGIFSLDFMGQSMLKNHRAAFDRLCALGGDDLLQQLMERGGTCLTDDPAAAKAGVRPIAGSSRFYLKTNNGDPTVLLSILTGIAGYGSIDAEFDPELVTLSSAAEDEDGSPEDPDDLDLDDPAALLEPEEEKEEELPARNASIVQKDGLYAIYDNDEEKFISLPMGDDTLTTMAVCQLVSEEKAYRGWQFKVNADDALWGWLSPEFNQVVPPTFEKLVVWESLYWSGVLAQSPAEENTSFRTLWALDCGRFTEFRSSDLPQEDAHFDVQTWTEPGSDYPSCRAYLYSPSVSAGKWFYQEDREGDGCSESSWDEFELKDGVLKQTDRCSANRVFLWPNKDISSFDYRNSKDKVGFEDAVRLSDDNVRDPYYAVKKDGAWALMWVRRPSGDDNYYLEPLTPFAFTNITRLEEDRHYFLVDQFGKKGVFDSDRCTYPISCDYESVTLLPSERTDDFWELSDYFRVWRMGFTGVIDGFDGSWSTPLHREEQS